MTHENYKLFYNSPDFQRFGRSEMPSQKRITESWLRQTNVPPTGVVLELGCGLGALSNTHPAWIGLDYSLPALRSGVRDAPRIQGDMQRLPVRSASIDFLMSWAAIEHVPQPEAVMEEVVRVLRPGGVAILAPAWNVRAWASKALPVRRYADLSLPDQLRKASIPIRNSLPWRVLAALPGRLRREAMLAMGMGVPFYYRPLTPDLEQYEYTDSDAFASIDAHAAVAYFASRNWQVLSHPGLVRRLMIRHDPVVVGKPIA